MLDLIAVLGTVQAEVSHASINDEVCALETIIPDGASIILVTPMGAG